LARREVAIIYGTWLDYAQGALKEGKKNEPILLGEKINGILKLEKEA
jgi:hypothetical protein